MQSEAHAHLASIRGPVCRRANEIAVVVLALAVTACTGNADEPREINGSANWSNYYRTERTPLDLETYVLNNTYRSRYLSETRTGWSDFVDVRTTLGQDAMQCDATTCVDTPFALDISEVPDDPDAPFLGLTCFLRAESTPSDTGTLFSFAAHGCYETGWLDDRSILSDQRTPAAVAAAGRCPLSDPTRCADLGELTVTIQANDERTACRCGADFTTSLQAIAADVRDRFAKLTPAQQGEVCSGLTDSKLNGDIYSLAFARGNSDLQVGDHGRYDQVCSDTVSVAGQCFLAGEVNYWLQGLSHNLCLSHDPALYNKPAMHLAINAYRSTKTPPGIEGRVDWFDRGWAAMDQLKSGTAYSIDRLMPDSGRAFSDPDPRIATFPTTSSPPSGEPWYQISAWRLTNYPGSEPPEIRP